MCPGDSPRIPNPESLNDDRGRDYEEESNGSSNGMASDYDMILRYASEAVAHALS